VNKTILAIDIGSTKIAAVIAEIDEYNDVKLIGHGITKSQGVKKGIITNIDLASKAIRKAVTDARRIAGSNISLAVVSISNAYAKSVKSTGIVNIPHKDITLKEINRVMETALYNANIPNDYEVIHVLPYNFKVDEQNGIEDPYGMNASRMEVDTNIIITQKSNLSNLKKAVKSAGLEIDSIVLNSYASAIATMSEDEKELGVVVIDMGGQTSNLAIHLGNAIRYNDYLPVGSNNITNDLSMTLHTPINFAEEVKLKYGDLAEVDSDEKIELPIIGDEENKNEIPLSVIHDVIEARVEESLMILAKSVEKSGLRDKIGTGVILTGGMTKLKHMREYAQTIFPGLTVRIGVPKAINGMFKELRDPIFSTVVGLLLYKAGGHTQYEINLNRDLLHNKEGEESIGLLDIRLEDRFVPSDNKEDVKESIKGEQKSERKPALPGIGDLDIGEYINPGNRNFLEKITNWFKQLF